MNLIYYILFFRDFFFIIIFSSYFLAFLLIAVIIKHIFLKLIRDKKYLKPIIEVKKKLISLDDLLEKPLVNIIIPAWKEGETFKKCLLAIKKLDYPFIKVIINGGGNEQTIQICNSFKKYENFIILNQKEGEGKLKAINDCLDHVNKGLICLIDADVYLSDQSFIYMIYYITNENNDVVTSPLRPHDSIINKTLVKYAYLNRYAGFKTIFSRNLKWGIGPYTFFKFDVIKQIKKFPIKKFSDDNRLIGSILLEKGFEIVYLFENNTESFTFPLNLNEYIQQNTRYLQNRLITINYKKEKLRFIQFILNVIASLYLFIFPFFFFYNVYLSLFGVVILLNYYLKRLRRCSFYKKISYGDFYKKFRFNFYFKMLFYIYVDAFINIKALFELIFSKKKYKTRKNIQ